jgi:hypothetical protein
VAAGGARSNFNEATSDRLAFVGRANILLGTYDGWPLALDQRFINGFCRAELVKYYYFASLRFVNMIKKPIHPQTRSASRSRPGLFSARARGRGDGERTRERRRRSRFLCGHRCQRLPTSRAHRVPGSLQPRCPGYFPIEPEGRECTDLGGPIRSMRATPRTCAIVTLPSCGPWPNHQSP